jgi:fructose-1-phosphate kinase PfkB-like protein
VADGAELRWLPSPSLAVDNPIGAGDAVVGGLGVALERGEPFGRAAELGLAAGAASVETATAGRLDARRASALAAAARPG